jgi:predicted transcriptional regulator
MEKVTNYIKLSSNPKLKMSPEGDFFRYWVEFLRPLHELTKREMDVLAEFLKVRYNLSKEIINTDRLDRVLMSEETKRDIRNTCGISAKHFQVIMSKFRKNGVIRDGKIHLNLIPTITEEGVGLMVHFSFKNEQHVKLGPQKSSQKS